MPLALLVLGCAGGEPWRADDGAATELDGAEARAYPPGRWRLAPREDLDEVALWVSHIVIMHRDSVPGVSVLRPPGWAPDSLPERSREQAAQLARDIARQAEASPERFAELARRHSDDDVTRALGGSLGGVQASQLPDEYLDALAALRPGEPSQVIATPMGFHIVHRRMPPPAQEVSGARIVIRYAGTIGGLADAPATRTRARAKELAERVARHARAGEAAFAELVELHSENADRLIGGDMGVWSTRSPGARPREVEALAALEMGEVSNPIDSFWGYQVLLRTPADPRSAYAMASVRFPAGSDEHAAEQRAAELATLLRDTPDAIGALERTGKVTIERWDLGHGSPELGVALDALALGESTPAPVRVALGYVVGVRLDPRIAPAAPRVRYELPWPALPDVAGLVGANEAQSLAPNLERLERALPELGLSGEELESTQRTLAVFRARLAESSTRDGRIEALDSSLRDLHGSVPEASYARIMTLIGHAVSTLVLEDAG